MTAPRSTPALLADVRATPPESAPLLSVDAALERLKAAAIALEFAAREEEPSYSDERHSAAECEIWDAGITYGEAVLRG